MLERIRSLDVVYTIADETTTHTQLEVMSMGTATDKGMMGWAWARKHS